MGHVRIEPWTLIELAQIGQKTLGYDPNTEMEWRNQASAHTDCLLNFKVSPTTEEICLLNKHFYEWSGIQMNVALLAAN